MASSSDLTLPYAALLRRMEAEATVIVDDLRSSARTAAALVEIASEAGATAPCAAFVVGKRFKQSHAIIEQMDVPVVTRARVERRENGRAILTQPQDHARHRLDRTDPIRLR